MKLKELLEKRATAVNNARAIYELAEKEDREPTAEERQQFDMLMDEVDKLTDEKSRIEKLEAREKMLAESQGRQGDLELAGNANDAKKKDAPVVVELRNSLFGDARQVVIPAERATEELKNSFCRYLVTGDNEMRALQKDSDVAGGYLSAPEVFQAELIKDVDNLTFMRQICRVLPPIMTAESLGCPSLDNDPADPTWVSELSIGSEDTTMSFGKRNLFPHPMAQFLKVSKTLLRRSTIPVDALVRERLAYKTAVVLENAFLNGTGGSQPLGVMVASDDGIPTGRDVSTGNTTTEIRFDGLIEAMYKLKGQYRSRVEWIFHRDAVKQIRKLKDGQGRYIWEASVQTGQPDRILNRPLRESEYMPNTFEAALYVGILGDFSNYWIVDALTMVIQVLTELYAATNQNGYIIRSDTDGMPVLSEAFVRVKLAS